MMKNREENKHKNIFRNKNYKKTIFPSFFWIRDEKLEKRTLVIKFLELKLFVSDCITEPYLSISTLSNVA